MSQEIQNLLGNTFVDKSGSSFDASRLAGKHVGLYFSAHWCPPCRGFTPQLAKSYETMKASNKNLEIVFVSSDRDEESFNEYLGEMPWIALPFADRERKATLSKKFKVQGIPTFIILDDKGEVVNSRGREAVSKDPKGDNFPWKPKTILETIANNVVDHQGNQVSLDELKQKELLGFYFSAHWCPPCKQFTPVLAECYKKLKAKGKNLEIVFVSSDRDDKSYKDYFASMPWVSVPFDAQEVSSELSDIFEVEGIPQLTFINPQTGKVVIPNGRSVVSADPEGSEYPWPAKPMVTLAAGTDYFNDKACFLVLTDKMDQAAATSAREALSAVATDLWEGRFKEVDDKPLAFVLGTSSDADLASRVRQFLGLPADASAFVMDIPNGQKFPFPAGSSLTKESLAKFAEDFLAGSLTPAGLKA